MAKRFLDAQLSLANNGTVAGTGTVPTTPVLINTLGLDLSAAGANAQVHFEGTVGLTTPTDGTRVTITVVRDGTTTVYKVVQDYEPTLAAARQTLSYNGADYLPPPGFHIYQVFISSSIEPTVLSGPVSFTAAGYSD